MIVEWFLFLFIQFFLFLSFLCLFYFFFPVDFVFVFCRSICCCVLLSLSCCCCCCCFFFLLFVFFKCSFHFSVSGLGLIFCWWENKFSYFGVVYKYLSVGMEMAVIKELFIILYISDMFFTNLVYFFYIYLFILLSYFNFSYSLCCVCYECVVINTWWCASLRVIVI